MNIYIVTDYSNHDDCDRHHVDVSDVVLITQCADEAYMYAVTQNVQNLAAMMEYDEEDYFDKDLQVLVLKSIRNAWKNWLDAYNELDDATFDWRQEPGEYSDSRTHNWTYVRLQHLNAQVSDVKLAEVQKKAEASKVQIEKLLDLFY